jgi:hypothetical protein
MTVTTADDRETSAEKIHMLKELVLRATSEGILYRKSVFP